ncbi:MAG: galactose mutarotase [Bacteroidales bacterium]|nr:galactose mutarotase [Bacteroidales bacterium]
MKKAAIFISAVLMMAAGCRNAETASIDLLPASDFGTTINDCPVSLYTLKAGDLVMQATNFGGRVVTLFAPDRNGEMADIVVGRRTISEYVTPEGERFLGACVGPVANRIGGASFTIDGVVYNVPNNDNDVNTLHGGLYGLDNIAWEVVESAEDKLVLHYLRPDGFEGYPGNLDITMTYSLTEDNEFKVEYKATTDKTTPVNISHHSFFNLKGEGNGDVLDYVMTINASAYTPIDELSIPLGQNESVEGTPFDFREPHSLGERIDTPDNQQIANARGYDHNWVLDRQTADGVELACTVWEKESGRFLEVLTDQPGIQFYSGNFFKGVGVGVSGKTMDFRSSIALETQHFPDSPNQPAFPSILLNPGETYTHVCIYRFSVKDGE